MKIGNLENKPVVTSVATERTGNAGEAAANTENASEPSAKVELSSAASLLQVDGSTAEFDQAKVERIAQAIRDGKFEVNPEAIADKLIANAQELLSRASH